MRKRGARRKELVLGSGQPPEVVDEGEDRLRVRNTQHKVSLSVT